MRPLVEDTFVWTVETDAARKCVRSDLFRADEDPSLQDNQWVVHDGTSMQYERPIFGELSKFARRPDCDAHRRAKVKRRLRKERIRRPFEKSAFAMAVGRKAVAVCFVLCHAVVWVNGALPDDLSNYLNEYVCDTGVRLVRQERRHCAANSLNVSSVDAGQETSETFRWL